MKKYCSFQLIMQEDDEKKYKNYYYLISFKMKSIKDIANLCVLNIREYLIGILE